MTGTRSQQPLGSDGFKAGIMKLKGRFEELLEKVHQATDPQPKQRKKDAATKGSKDATSVVERLSIPSLKLYVKRCGELDKTCAKREFNFPSMLAGPEESEEYEKLESDLNIMEREFEAAMTLMQLFVNQRPSYH